MKRPFTRKARVVRHKDTYERTYHWREVQNALGIPGDERLLVVRGPGWGLGGGHITVTTIKP